jgi:uncharacterized Zn finger protein
MNLAELTTCLTALGCPADKAPEMAAQLDKRARQLAQQKNKSYEEAMTHLLRLMKQGWAAQEKGLGDIPPK